MTKLVLLKIHNNQLNGDIPAEIGSMSSLEPLNLKNNQFSGTIPAEMGDLAALKWLSLKNNELIGPVPTRLMDLSNLVDHESDFCSNNLWTDNQPLREFLNLKQIDGNWESCQTPFKGDFDYDHDVDGLDAAKYTKIIDSISLERFSGNFGLTESG